MCCNMLSQYNICTQKIDSNKETKKGVTPKNEKLTK